MATSATLRWYLWRGDLLMERPQLIVCDDPCQPGERAHGGTGDRAAARQSQPLRYPAALVRADAEPARDDARRGLQLSAARRMLGGRVAAQDCPAGRGVASQRERALHAHRHPRGELD